MKRKLFGPQELESRRVFAADIFEPQISDPVAAANQWQNPGDPLDVNDNGKIEVVDALLVINPLLETGERQLNAAIDPPGPPFFDVEGDGDLSVVDALLVINWLLVNGETPAMPSQPPTIAVEPPASLIDPEAVDLAIETRGEASETIAADLAFAVSVSETNVFAGETIRGESIGRLPIVR